MRIPSCVGKIPRKRAWRSIAVFLPGELQNRGAWWIIVHGATKSQTWLKQLSMPTRISTSPRSETSLSFAIPIPWSSPILSILLTCFKTTLVSILTAVFLSWVAIYLAGLLRNLKLLLSLQRLPSLHHFFCTEFSMLNFPWSSYIYRIRRAPVIYHTNSQFTACILIAYA